MRIIAITVLSTLVASAAWAQQPPAPTKTFSSAADVAALLAKAKADHKDGQPTVVETICISRPITRTLNIEPAWVQPPFTSTKQKCSTYWMALPRSLPAASSPMKNEPTPRTLPAPALKAVTRKPWRKAMSSSFLKIRRIGSAPSTEQ